MIDTINLACYAIYVFNTQNYSEIVIGLIFYRGNTRPNNGTDNGHRYLL